MSISLNFLKKPTTLLSLAAALGMSAMTGQAQANTVLTNLNLDSYFTGETLSGVAGFPMTTVNVLQTSTGGANGVGSVVGTLGNCVFQITAGSFDVGDYVYEEKFTETVGSDMGGSFSSLSTQTPTNFPGLTGEAGYSFSGVAALGITGPASSAFTIAVSALPNGHLAYTNGQGTYNEGVSETFFYVSTDAPGTGVYQVNDDVTGQATSYAPVVAVPVPAAASMGMIALAGLAGFGLLRRRMAAV